MFLERFYPDEMCRSNYDIDYERLYKEGYRGVIFDIDNTLVPPDEPADERAIAFFEKLRAIGFDTVLLSNNKGPRIESFASQVGSKYVTEALKPTKGGYKRALRLMKLPRLSVLCVGDQIFTDVWGARRTGIHSILVGQLEKKEEVQIVAKRLLEKLVLHFYRKVQ